VRIDGEGVERRRELHAAAGDPGMGCARLDDRMALEEVGALAHRPSVGADEPRRDRSLRPRAALEKAALDQQHVGSPP
jgi:hypothetical protein